MSGLDFQQLLFIVLAPACSVFLVILISRVVTNLKEARNRAFLALVIADMGWLLSNWLEALWPTREGTMLLMKIAYVFIAALPVAWLEYSLATAGKRGRGTAARVAVLLIIPAVTAGMAFTNDYHGLLWSNYSFSRVLGLPFLRAEFGPWFWIHALYSYALVAVGAGLVLDAYRGLARSLKGQAKLSVAAVALPLAYNIAYVTGMLSFIRKDFTSVIFSISAALFAFASDRYGLFSIVPIARSTLFDSLRSAIFVLNDEGRILDANAAARELCPGAEPVGLLAAQVKPLELVARSLSKAGPWEADVAVDTPFGRRPHELSCKPLQDERGRRVGVIVSLHDVAVRYELVKETSALVSASMRDPLTAADRSLPLCSGCHKARGKDGAWKPLPLALQERYGIMVTHGLCPDCLPRYAAGAVRDGEKGKAHDEHEL